MATRPEASSGAAVPDPAVSRSQAAAPRVLIAIEDKYRIYREVMGEFLRSARPRFEVRVVDPTGLRAELRRFGPQIVVYAGPPAPIPDLLPCWVELSLEPNLPSVLQTGRVRREVVNPSLDDLLAVMDQAAPVWP